MGEAGEEEVEDWFDPSPFIDDSHKLTEVVGFWPSFDDAAVLRLQLDCTDGSPWKQGSDSPTLDVTVRLAETGFFLAQIQFKNVTKIDLSNFSYQNEILEIVFDRVPDTVDSEGRFWPAKMLVEIQAHCGLQAKFECKSAAVLSVVPCDKDGSISETSAN